MPSTIQLKDRHGVYGIEDQLTPSLNAQGKCVDKPGNITVLGLLPERSHQQAVTTAKKFDVKQVVH